MLSGCSGYCFGSKIWAELTFLGESFVHLVFWVPEVLHFCWVSKKYDG